MLRFIATILIFIGLYFFCESQTKGFRLQEILSDIPNEARWEVAPLSDPNSLQTKLKQSFRYLGSGEQSHAFLGEDQKTVLKFFRHNDLSLMKIVNRFPAPWLWQVMKKYDPRPGFDSCKFAYEQLQEQTGLMCLHLNKTEGKFPKVVLIDNLGISNEVDLDKTEFMVQDYCELAISRIDTLMKKQDLNGAVVAMKALFTSIEALCRQGVRIDNPGLKRNIGFSGDKVIMLDVGSLKKEENPKTPGQIKKDVKRVMRVLGHWINKHHPELYPSFEEELKRS